MLPSSATATRAVFVHGLADARTAFSVAAELGLPLLLVSAPCAAAHAGARWFRGVIAQAATEFPAVAHTAILDCDDRAGDALGAIAAGAPFVLFTGREDVRARLADIAGQAGTEILAERPPALDLRGRHGPRLLCRAWLSGMPVAEL